MEESSQVVDLSSALPTDTEILEIKYRGTDKGTGWKITIAGPGHPKTVAASKDHSRDQLRKARAIEQAQANGRKYKAEDDTPEEVARRNVDLIVQRIVGWSPDPLFKSISDEPIAFSHAAAVDLLLRHDMGWALGQIADFLSSDTAFTQASAKT